jgi:SAM-dependent methyltransferase
MLIYIRTLKSYLLKNNYEQEKILSFVKRYCNQPTPKILDVGCGEGRYLKALVAEGYDATGVETNEVLRLKNKSNGLNCMSVQEFELSENLYDLILMSHIIEHFNPNALKIFLESYLDRLRENGILIIATPLMNHRFYDDFDHIKPYSPIGILMVFGGDNAQVQYYSTSKIRIVDLWFRTSYYRLSHFRSRYFVTIYSRLNLVLELISACLWRVSFGIIGFKSGWVGVFEKIK